MMPSTLGTRSGRLCTVVLSACAITITSAGLAFAQISLPNVATLEHGLTIRGVDSAHDPQNDVYLAVSAFGGVTGVFVNNIGAPISGPFPISAPGGAHTNYVRARYSPHVNGGAGGFLVAWSSENTGVLTRVVTYPAGPVGGLNLISGPARIETAPAVAYSPSSQRFLVVWQGLLNEGVIARLVSLDGAPVGAPVVLSPPGYARDPGVTWNPNTNEFGVSFDGESGSGGYSAVAIVPAANPAAFTRHTFNFLPGALTFITDIDYSPTSNRYVMTWYEAVKAKTAEIDPGGNPLASGVASFRVGIYDSLSVAYNPVSGTFLLGGLDPQTDNLTAAELNGQGVRFAPEMAVGPAPGYYARVSSSQTAPLWNVQYSKQFRAVDVAVQTSTRGGGPAGSYGSGGATPPPAPTPSSSCPGTVPGMICVNGNWVPATTAPPPPPPPSSCPGTVPGMICVNGNWVPVTAAPPPPPPPPPPAPAPSSCPGFVPGMTCVNGNWVPGIAPPPPAPAPSSCPGTVPGMVCVNGNWVPGTAAPTSSCPGFVPGMVCVNGNWVPTTAAPPPPPPPPPPAPAPSSCPGFVPGMTCVNGNWVPDAGSVTGSSTPSSTGGTACPGFVPGMTCVNGNWTPGLPICVGGTPAPDPTWVRIGLFDWVPQNHPAASRATCRAS